MTQPLGAPLNGEVRGTGSAGSGVNAASAASLPAGAALFWTFVPYAIVSVVHVLAIIFGWAIEYPTKLLLMPALALAAVWVMWGAKRAAGADAGGGAGGTGIAPFAGALALLCAGVFFSWLGDGSAFFFPMFEDELPMMLLCFGLAHVAYLVLMWRGRGIAQRSFPKWALLYVAAYATLLIVLLPHTGALTVPVVIYGALLVGTAAMASRCGPVVAWGGAWFLASDAILSLRIFLPEGLPAWSGAAIMITYTLGQGLIVAGIVRALQRRARAAA